MNPTRLMFAVEKQEKLKCPAMQPAIQELGYLNDEAVHTLERTLWFSLLPHHEKLSLYKIVKEFSVSTGSSLFRAGTTPQGWFVVIRGLLKWSALSEKGRSVSLVGLSAGSWFGEASLTLNHPYGYDVVALRDSRVLLLPREACEHLIKTHLPFSQAMMKHLSSRVNWFMGAYAAQFLLSVDAKVAHSLANLFHSELHPTTERYLQISQEELANLCGISRQRCNVALNYFKKMKLLDIVYGGIAVLDLEGLRRFSQSESEFFRQ